MTNSRRPKRQFKPKPKLRAKSEGIALKKRYGQHFLTDEKYLECMFDAVSLDSSSSVLEIGCGEGFLTQAILRYPIARLFVFEIDPEWADHVRNKIPDKRLSINTTNFLDVNLAPLEEFAPWTILANLPYQVTFPILHRFQAFRNYIKEGVVMVQDEVALKITKKSGRGYGFPSLYFQHYFDWKLLDKVPPAAFYPPPKVNSRLIYFKPIANPVPIANEEQFWEFIKKCFAQPRRTLANNLKGSKYPVDLISEDILKLRAQQMQFEQLLQMWESIKNKS